MDADQKKIDTPFPDRRFYRYASLKTYVLISFSTSSI